MIKQDAAQALWNDFYTNEIHPRLLAVRPKLAGFEAQMATEASRKAFLKSWSEHDSPEEMTTKAMQAFPLFKYLKNSGF